MPRRYYLNLVLASLLSCLVIIGYFFLSQPKEHTPVAATDTTYRYRAVAGPIQPIPEISQVNQNWARLGKALFNSTLLSKDNSISCASCHLVGFGGDDGFPVSTGINSATGTRNSPTVLNAVFNLSQFWDGRATTLAEQVSGPVHNPLEMGTSWPEVVEKLSADEAFSELFAQISPEGITPNAIIKAITTFEETLITPGAPIDRYLLGDIYALSVQQLRGLEKFNSFGCVTCHQGTNIGGNVFQKFGRLDEVPESMSQDMGRYGVTGREEDKFVFKVPSLRNVAETAPYFHDGSVKTLPEAVRLMARVQLGRDLAPEDIADLVALLQAFSAPYEEL